MNNKTILEVVFVSYDTPIAKAIQGFTESKWGHVAIITKRENGIVTMHEAQLLDGLQPVTFTELEVAEYVRDGVMEIERILVDMPMREIYERAVAYEGTDYDKLAILLIVMLRYAKLINHVLKRIKLEINFEKLVYLFDNARQFICSEFAAMLIYDASYKKYDIAKYFNKPKGQVTPIDVKNYIRDLKDGEVALVEELEERVEEIKQKKGLTMDELKEVLKRRWD